MPDIYSGSWAAISVKANLRCACSVTHLHAVAAWFIHTGPHSHRRSTSSKKTRLYCCLKLDHAPPAHCFWRFKGGECASPPPSLDIRHRKSPGSIFWVFLATWMDTLPKLKIMCAPRSLDVFMCQKGDVKAVHGWRSGLWAFGTGWTQRWGVSLTTHAVPRMGCCRIGLVVNLLVC